MLNDCPFCGSKLDIDDPDVIYKSGIGWKYLDDYLKVYDSVLKNPNECLTYCWDVNCPTIYGGCGASITGDSREEVIQKWNRRK